jgi:hypothetical protein
MHSLRAVLACMEQEATRDSLASDKIEKQVKTAQDNKRKEKEVEEARYTVYSSVYLLYSYKGTKKDT